MWAVATLPKRSHEPFLEALAAESNTKVAHFECQSLSNVAWACDSSRKSDTLCDNMRSIACDRFLSCGSAEAVNWIDFGSAMHVDPLQSSVRPIFQQMLDKIILGPLLQSLVV